MRRAPHSSTPFHHLSTQFQERRLLRYAQDCNTSTDVRWKKNRVAYHWMVVAVPLVSGGAAMNDVWTTLNPNNSGNTLTSPNSAFINKQRRTHSRPESVNGHAEGIHGRMNGIGVLATSSCQWACPRPDNGMESTNRL